MSLLQNKLCSQENILGSSNCDLSLQCHLKQFFCALCSLIFMQLLKTYT